MVGAKPAPHHLITPLSCRLRPAPYPKAAAVPLSARRFPHPGTPLSRPLTTFFLSFLLLALPLACDRAANKSEPDVAPAEAPQAERPATLPRAPKTRTRRPATPPKPPRIGRFIPLVGGIVKRPFVVPTTSSLPISPHRDVIDLRRSEDGTLTALLRPGDVFVETRDEGLSWRVRKLDSPLLQIIPGPGHWWGLGELDDLGHATRVTRSSDQGKTWKPRLTGKRLLPQPTLLQRTGSRTLWLVVGRHLVHTRNAGKSWMWVDPGVDSTITIVQTVPSRLKGAPDEVWVGAEGGRVAHRDADGDWHAEQLPLLKRHAVRGFGRSTLRTGERGDLFAATERGLYRRDGVEQWGRVRDMGGRRYYGVVFDTSGVGMVYGAAGEVAVTEDGGARWRRITHQALEAVGYGARATSSVDVLDINWRFAALVREGVLLYGDDLTIVRWVAPGG